MTPPTGRPTFSRETTLRLTEGLSALTHLISSLEYLVDDEDRRTGGLNDYEVFRAADRIRSPLAGRAVRIASRAEVTRGLHAVRVVAAGTLLLPVGRRARLAADAVLTGSQLALYPRNHYGSDGSDQASFLVQASATLARASARPATADAALWFVAAQSALSYGVSGGTKLFGPAWRSGEALENILRTMNYGDRDMWNLVRRHPGPARVLGAGVLAMESLFPVVLFGRGRRLAPLAVGAAASFHLANARLMGLNRFLPAFLAMHPSVLYVAGPRERTDRAGRPERRDDLMPSVLAAGGAAVAVVGWSAARRRQQLIRRGRPGELSASMPSGNVLRHRTSGPDAGTGPLVVCESGLSATAEHWEWFSRQLGQRHPVLTYNRAGYGASRRARGADPGLTGVVDDLVDLARSRAGGRAVVLVGHSLGGYLAWRAAQRLGSQVQALVLVDPTHPAELEQFESPELTSARLRNGLRDTAWWLRLGMGALMAPPAWVDGLPPEVRPLACAHLRDPRVWSAARREWRAAERSFATVPLGRVQAPALVLTAERTARNNPVQHELHKQLALRSAQPGSAARVIERCDHDSILLSPEPAGRLAGLVREFLEQQPDVEGRPAPATGR